MMEFKDLPVDVKSYRLESVATAVLGDLRGSRPLPVKGVIPIDSSLFHVAAAGTTLTLSAADKGTGMRLCDDLATGGDFLAEIEPLSTGTRFELRIAFFFQQAFEMGDVEIAVDEDVVKRFGKLDGVRGRTVKSLCDAMRSDFTYIHGGEQYFFFVAGPALDSDLESADEAEYRKAKAAYEKRARRHPENNQDEPPSPPERINLAAKGKAFGIIGRDVVFAAAEEELPGIGTAFVASKITKRINRSGRSVRLAHGKLIFSDMTKTGKIADLARLQLEALSREGSTYLKIWDEYGDMEGEFLLERARRYGILYFTDVLSDYEGLTSVRIVDASSETALKELAVSGIESVELVRDVPSYLENPDLSFEEFVYELMAENRLIRTEGRRRPDKRTYKVKGFDDGANRLILKTDEIKETSGKFILDIGGEITQIKRRAEARKRIRDCEAANPQLGVILEPGARIPRVRNVARARVPLNTSVAQKIFPNNDPTPSQRRAIEVALNTPDIALIQGPPGTGKTTVIAAIVERLNQIYTEKGENPKGVVLLSGYQHDAVENMIRRMSLNGLPCVPKFGKSNAEKESGAPSAYESALGRWCDDIAQQIREKYPKIEQAGSSSKIQTMALQYTKAPTDALAIELLGEIANAPVGSIDTSLRNRARQQLEALNYRESAISRPDTLPLVRALRTKRSSFADDGPERAVDVLDRLAGSELLTSSDRKLLSKASAWSAGQKLEFLNELAEFKARLLEQLTAPDEFHVPKPNEIVLDLAKEYIEQSAKPARTNGDEKMRVLSEFLTNLEGNHFGMLDAMSEYSFAFAATCQQSHSYTMVQAKGEASDARNGDLVYEYVIIDEAARVAPRDLMIPMSQGKKIILVGDHRQLPHIIDEKIADAISHESETPLDPNWIKTSMFQYLFTKRVLELEKDGICRHVTLDTQFRMHPLLGKFVSKSFYERESGGAETVESGLGAEHYSHNLPGTANKPLGWIDVPRGMGKEDKYEDTPSYYREAEANAIIKQLRQWLSSDEGKELTFGIISFYKGQSDYIKKELGDLVDGIRVRVGTVDAFQGMEFDVVFLSMVRTLPDNVKTNEFSGNAPAVKERPQDEDARYGSFARFKDRRRSGQRKDAVEADATNAADNLDSPDAYRRASADPAEERLANMRFGFLTMYNRLNVSMSRQKKMLVVAGDSRLLKTELSEKYIPGLVDFYHLCLASGVMLPCK